MPTNLPCEETHHTEYGLGKAFKGRGKLVETLFCASRVAHLLFASTGPDFIM